MVKFEYQVVYNFCFNHIVCNTFDVLALKLFVVYLNMNILQYNLSSY
jgi:hypothetical protein